jgi:general secretion pathway protein G
MKTPFPRRSNRSGYTLLEMILVLTIMGLLAGLVIYNLVGVGDTAKVQKAETDVLGFKEMLAAYQLESGTLPTTEQGLSALWVKPTAEPIPQRWRAMLDHEIDDPWGHPYQYRNPGKRNPDKYDVFSMGPDGLPDTDDDIGNWQSTPSPSSSSH